jgi:hypothetical protein
MEGQNKGVAKGHLDQVRILRTQLGYISGRKASPLIVRGTGFPVEWVFRLASPLLAYPTSATYHD